MRDANSNGSNRIVWAVAAVLALGYLSLQAWTATSVVNLRERMIRVETQQGIVAE